MGEFVAGNACGMSSKLRSVGFVVNYVPVVLFTVGCSDGGVNGNVCSVAKLHKLTGNRPLLNIGLGISCLKLLLIKLQSQAKLLQLAMIYIAPACAAHS